VHLSSSDAVAMLRAAKEEGLPITAETTYHYLYFSAEDVPDGNTLFKCCPPIREKNNRDKLWYQRHLPTASPMCWHSSHNHHLRGGLVMLSSQAST
jgi:hypothetical protein